LISTRGRRPIAERSVRFMRLSKVLFGIAIAFGVIGCGESGFHVRYAPGFSAKGRHISVFGVKRDGLMNRAGWAALGPNLSPPFNGSSCEVAYSEDFFSAQPALSTTVDDYVRANGVSDDLLAQLAPAARGDTIMLFTIAGHPLQPSNEVGSQIQPAAMPSASSRGSPRRGRRSGGGLAPEKSSSSGEPFNLSATFYSVADRRSVAVVEYDYSGARIDEAINAFRNKLEEEFPGSTCAGWDWTAHLDENGIKQLSEQ
jgi:hypothetical protein